MRKILTLATLLSLLLAVPAAGQLMVYSDARPLAEQQEKESPPEYLQQLTVFYQEFAHQTIPACAEQLNEQDGSLMSVVSKLDAQGKVQHTWKLGTSKLLPCFVAAIEKASFPKPPVQPYYTVIDVRGDPEEFKQKNPSK